MKKNYFIRILKFICLSIFLFVAFSAKAEINFDFGLPIFGKQEVKFEQSKSADFNFSLLKKFIHDKQDDIVSQLHIVNRWFSLIKLSDDARKPELLKLGKEFFDTTNKESSPNEKTLDTFYKGLVLCSDKESDPENQKDEAFENFLLDTEEKLKNNPNYWIIKGILFHALKDRPNGYFATMKPEEDLKQALNLIPKTAHYYYIMGQAFRFLNSNETPLFLAIAAYEKASSLAPRNSKLQNSLLSIYMGLHEEMKSTGKREPFWLEEAVYKKILDVSPANSHAMNNLGYLYAEYGVNLDQALELCKRAVATTPNNAGFRDSLGWAAFKAKDYKLAESELLKAIKLRENFYDAHYHLATVYYTNENLKDAAVHYEKAIEIKPDSAESLNNLAYLYAEQDTNNKIAIEMAERAVKIDPNNASYLDTLGWAQYRAKNFKAALDAIKKADELAPGQGEILLHLGRIYLDSNDYVSAIRYLKEAFRIDPELKDPDNSMYLAVQLHAQITALSNYHNIMGLKADKEKIQKILNLIAQLYQEERLYDKAIEIAKVSSELKLGKISLDKPILPGYSLTEKLSLEKTENNPLSATEQIKEEKTHDPEVKEPVSKPSKTENSTSAFERNLGELPIDIGQSFILSFGPSFFKFVSPVLSFAENFSDKKVTIFIGNLVKPYETTTLRITSEKVPGVSMMRAFDGYLKNIGFKRKGDINSDTFEYLRFNKKISVASLDRSLYVSLGELKGAMAPEEYSQVFLYDKKTFIDVYANWTNIHNNLPYWLKMVISNPLKPFLKVYTKFAIKNGILNEFSIATNNKIEDDEFLKEHARRLFSLKYRKHRKGLDITVKLSRHKEKIYTYIDYNNGRTWIINKLNREISRFNPILVSFAKYRLDTAICFLNRFLASSRQHCCPLKGETKLDERQGLYLCDKHSGSPVIPLIFDESKACEFSRARLYSVMKQQIKQYFEGKPNEEDRKNLIEELKDYTAALIQYSCPSVDEWEIDKDGIKCPIHKN